MKLLFIHVDYFNYKVKKETELAEKIDSSQRSGETENSLLVLLSVEKEDEESKTGSDKLVSRALNEIEEIVTQIKVENITLFPFAHLSESLSSPDYAISVLKKLEKKAKKSGLNTLRVPFGWYKNFELKSKGHPLSVLSRTIHL
ncbi:hypothetical protein AKJ66_00320 [candidate division MSBL1 archaeon SCGC-AAA259E22]|uniref:Threonyl-tRNA synthetase editing domain-containing protein n=1 Tax=candidate division MSBL1 archaeon SCGC-AAA259E22 TaxID=1698265 RepID=A0A133UI93_9EURY|nr:hypothetical protein AKJ66_00320 [candidate division MSBL1 archaeon SCGC-AAA259E22]